MLGRWLAILLVTASLSPLGGCRICADCEDLAYPAYGGAWQRTRRDDGRVGSLFDPAGAQATNLIDRDEPPTPDALERLRQQQRENQMESPDRRQDLESSEPESDSPDSTKSSDALRELELDDIRGKGEEEMRQKTLEDIDIRFVPSIAVPPELH